MVHLLVLRAGTHLLGIKPHFGVLMGSIVTATVFALALGLSWVLYEAVECPARRLLLRRRRATAPAHPEPQPQPATKD
ncbi:hypothetical protein [Streptomyces broussonetiae]|uniref:hypothetical protein n=1 Tax=Streptomyces broussonetiae TaxID=2686304 RepID=UPI0035D66A5E